ncbi:CocE/NonD family hydrolase, partial [Escherichia coli]|nr:CocE/NonD family hydrolase [Escherichia coli]
EWSSDEIRDGAEIVDWIVRQPWCNGTVAALGNSYDGTSAELLLVNQHPAVRVIAPCFSLFDVYTDIAFPGGIHAAWFTDTWGRYNEALDRNALHEVVGWWAK